MMAARPGRWIVSIAFFAICGCSDPDPIRVHDETPPPKPKVPEIPAEQKKFRTLAAMVPVDDERENVQHWWFFKLSGAISLVSKYEDDFNKLIETVRAESGPNNPICWKLPTGWRQEMGQQDSGMVKRYASLKAPGGDAEVSVSQAGGMISSNVQRWWIQLWGRDHAEEVNQATVGGFINKRLVNQRLIITVDLTGPKDPNLKDPNGGPMMGHPHGGQ